MVVANSIHDYNRQPAQIAAAATVINQGRGTMQIDWAYLRKG